MQNHIAYEWLYMRNHYPLPLSLAAITGFSLSPSCDMALASYPLLSIRDRSSYKPQN